MFQDPDLQQALEQNHTLSIAPLIISEFNLNDLENISKIGNYSWRPFATGQDHIALQETYDPDNVGNYYNNGQISYEEYKQTQDPNPFTVEDKSPELFYSLGDCFLPFRPRSGINKARSISGKYFVDNIKSGERPRYYFPSRQDYFKYWSSYKRDGVKERGISFPTVSHHGAYGIDDAAPFVVYTQPIVANRIVVKMQTNVGSVDVGTVRASDGSYITDPLFDYNNATVPTHWKIQKLDESNNWIDLINFNHNSARYNPQTQQRDLPIVPKDGTLELFYGIVVPDEYIETFNFLGYIHESLIPTVGSIVGEAYIYGSSTTEAGTLTIWNGTQWNDSPAEYNWSLLEDIHLKTNGNCLKIVDPLFFDPLVGSRVYREFSKIHGIRVAVKTMNSPESCFDVIEISPRLSCDITSYVNQYDVAKVLLGSDSGLPVGFLAASNGNISLSNMDDAFSEANLFNGVTGSIVANLLGQNIKFMFYETIFDINGSNKYVPIKTMYSDRFISAISGTSDVSIPLRDLFFRLETTNAPSVLSKDTRLTYAVAQVLDYIGFSNFVFRMDTSKPEPVLPYFFVEKGASVADILQRIAVATQSAMFFDEYNNFVVMSKEYLFPESDLRGTDISLSGNIAATVLPNIESISPNESIILNNGVVNYTIKYIQKEVSTVGSSIKLDNERSYRYKPVLLWEVSSNEQTKTINQSAQDASGFALGAMALNYDLSSSLPSVDSNRNLINNIIDFGESIYWLPRYQGYLYSNGEIIRFDAVEYAVAGASTPLVWITNNQEYQEYFSKLPFNGKIYPTGRVRIFSEPYYEDVNNQTVLKIGAVSRHGRGQFDTAVTSHYAGLSDYWSDNANTYGIDMKSENLFSTTPTEDLQAPALTGTTHIVSATTNNVARKSSRNGIMKNFMASKVYEDGYVNKLKTTNAGTIQSSALVFRGPRRDSAIPNNRDLVSYVYKDLSVASDTNQASAFKHFGTRMRIVGKSDQNFGQVANGSSDYYGIMAETTEDSASVNGGSGGIGIFVDPNTGCGYFFEIVALSNSNIDQYVGMTNPSGDEIAVHNIVFYKVNNKTGSGENANKAIPQKLWGGLSEIIVDAGIFAGQDRLAIGESNSVYDLSIEYQVMNDGAINFYLFINNILIKAVKDRNPLPVKTTAALFVRASSECMFENFYAIEDLTVRNSNSIIANTENIFDKTSITTNEFMSKYAISGMIQSTYLTNISPNNPLKMKLYYEEFGTIMREAVHFNVEYDKAYPAFYSRIAKTFSSDKSYTVSGYYGGPYEAEFIIFNAADKAIVLDDTTGTYLRILGVTFTQNSVENLSVDDYYNQLSDFSNPEYNNNYLVSPQDSLNNFNKIKASRSKYGNREFTLDSIYIQSKDQAEDLMKWLINKTMKPRKDLSVTIFPMPHLQLGDIVNIEYSSPSDIEYVDPSKRFVVTDIQYSHQADNIDQKIRVVEI